MPSEKNNHQIAILGGGPSGLFMYKRLIESGHPNLEISIFEKKAQLGAGMPYSTDGANTEHITNVSDNEIPQIYTSISEWVKTAPKAILERFAIDPDNFNEYKVLPRLFFGEYLAAQFDLLRSDASAKGIQTHVYLSTTVTDITDQPKQQKVKISLADDMQLLFDHVVVCTGHRWPKTHEGKTSGYYDAPYPPAKLEKCVDHPIAIRGSSLTAIDAIRTLARHNGTFTHHQDGQYSYQTHNNQSNFKLVMHARSGLLPAIRFHLDDTHLRPGSLLSEAEIAAHRQNNDGFLSLDFIFQENFKKQFKEKDPDFYERIKDMDLEQFVDSMMELRERLDPFQLFRAEYTEAEKSIKRKESVYWKEMLAVLSFAMNYPAKYLSAEDMQRLQKVLMPLISIVIAFVPQGSARELLALYDAGVLSLVQVGSDSRVEPKAQGGIVYHYVDANGEERNDHFDTFVDCIGQPHLSYHDFPFKSLLAQGNISEAMLRYRDNAKGKAQAEQDAAQVYQDQQGNYYLKVPGITINDHFQVVDNYGMANPRVYMMAVPYIGGFNPDYSGLDFCEAASERIVKNLFEPTF